MNFQEAQSYLNSLQLHKIKLGLDSMEMFLARVDRPEKKLKFVHVAGTNGKGSVSVTIVKVLGCAGFRVGLFTSPHLSSVRERFRINDTFISEQKFAELASRVREVLGPEMITYFEFTTAIALLWFAEEQVDLVVLETGLGGRLDATNVVLPMVGVITNVTMDHEAYLGYDLKSISFEKAGIIKRAIPLVSGAAQDVSLEVIEARCLELAAPLYLYGRDFLSEGESNGRWSWKPVNSALGDETHRGLRCSMRGEYQRNNVSLAIAVIRLLRRLGFSCRDEDIRKGIVEVRWPGRLECIVLRRDDRTVVAQDRKNDKNHVRYLIDGAHNPAGVASLVQTLALEYSYENLIVVWGAMMDKDLQQTVPSIAAMAATIILTRPAGERSAAPAKLFEVIPEKLKSRCHLIDSVRDALAFAEEKAQADDMIVVAGSLYLIGEVRAHLVGHLVDQ